MHQSCTGYDYHSVSGTTWPSTGQLEQHLPRVGQKRRFLLDPRQLAARHWIWRLPECDPQLAQERRTVYFAESGQQDFVARALKASSHPCQLLLLAVGSSCILRDLLVEDTKNVKTCTTSAVLPLFLSLDRPVEVLADVLRGEGNHAEARLQ